MQARGAEGYSVVETKNEDLGPEAILDAQVAR